MICYRGKIQLRAVSTGVNTFEAQYAGAVAIFAASNRTYILKGDYLSGAGFE